MSENNPSPSLPSLPANPSNPPDALEKDGEHSGFQPRGIVLFLFVMLLGYALYWAYLWFITVIERGVGG